jgi:hypothetical protein
MGHSPSAVVSSKRTLIDGIEKSASCHECDGASDADYALEQILQFFEIAWQIIVWTHPTVRRWSRSLTTVLAQE